MWSGLTPFGGGRIREDFIERFCPKVEKNDIIFFPLQR